MLRDLPWEDSLDLEAGALPELLGPALAPSTAQSTLQVLVLALEGLLAHGTLLIDTPELEEFGAEGLGFLLRGVQHRLRLLMPLSPVVQAFVKVLLLLVHHGCHRVGLSKVQQGIPKLQLQSVPGPLQGGICGIGHPHGFSSLLQLNCQLLLEKGRHKQRVKPQPSESSSTLSLVKDSAWVQTRVVPEIG